MKTLKLSKIIGVMVGMTISMFFITMCSSTYPLATPTNQKQQSKIPTHVDSYIKRFLKTAKQEAKLFNIPVSQTGLTNNVSSIYGNILVFHYILQKQSNS